jgi:membrane protein DedA with SNARE-associated domain
MLWSALWLAPVLYLVELTGPEWLNLLLRGLWLSLAILTVLAGIWLWATQRSTRARR